MDHLTDYWTRDTLHPIDLLDIRVRSRSLLLALEFLLAPRERPGHRGLSALLHVVERRLPVRTTSVSAVAKQRPRQSPREKATGGMSTPVRVVSVAREWTCLFGLDYKEPNEDHAYYVPSRKYEVIWRD